MAAWRIQHGRMQSAMLMKKDVGSWTLLKNHYTKVLNKPEQVSGSVISATQFKHMQKGKASRSYGILQDMASGQLFMRNRISRISVCRIKEIGRASCRERVVN